MSPCPKKQTLAAALLLSVYGLGACSGDDSATLGEAALVGDASAEMELDAAPRLRDAGVSNAMTSQPGTQTSAADMDALGGVTDRSATDAELPFLDATLSDGATLDALSEQTTPAISTVDAAADSPVDTAHLDGAVEAAEAIAEASSSAEAGEPSADAGPAVAEVGEAGGIAGSMSISTSQDASVDADTNEAASDAAVVTEASADGGLSMTAAIILQTQGAECEACASTMCLNAGPTCESLDGQVAAAGPKAGVSKTELCYETLSCLLDPSPTVPCYDQGAAPLSCYCGVESSFVCENSGPAANAQCTVQEQNGLETQNPATVPGRFETTSFASGTANVVFDCISTSCAADCLLQ